jgi:hypothetical protein
MADGDGLMQIIYASETPGIPEAELEALLTTSRDRNARAGVTGMLVVGEGKILQALEGPEDAVRALYARIARDRRHHDCRVLWERTVGERAFGRWSMGFATLSQERLRAVPGFVDFFATDFDVDSFRQLGGLPRFMMLAFRDP